MKKAMPFEAVACDLAASRRSEGGGSSDGSRLPKESRGGKGVVPREGTSI